MTTVSPRTPAWFWAVSIAALLWNIVGVAAWVGDITMSDEALGALPEAQQALYAARPVWLPAVNGIAVLGGLAGALALLARRRIAALLFQVSLAAVVVLFGYMFAMTDMLAVMGASSLVFPLIVFLIAAFLVWFAGRASARNWLH